VNRTIAANVLLRFMPGLTDDAHERM
jgi:hypothetical protein